MAKKGRAIPDHKKHQVFPGFIPSPDVVIQAGTIKGSKRNVLPESNVKHKPLGSEWDSYEAALLEVRNSNKNASSAALQLRKGYEERYYQASRAMMREGKIARLKKKYR